MNTLQKVCQTSPPFLQERRAEFIFANRQSRMKTLQAKLRLTENALRGQRWHGAARIRERHQELPSQIIELGVSFSVSITTFIIESN